MNLDRPPEGRPACPYKKIFPGVLASGSFWARIPEQMGSKTNLSPRCYPSFGIARSSGLMICPKAHLVGKIFDDLFMLVYLQKVTEEIYSVDPRTGFNLGCIHNFRH